MTTSSALHASIASALVTANLGFGSLLEGSPEGRSERIYRLPFSFRGQACMVTGYVGGVTLTVLCAVQLDVPLSDLSSRRHQVADALAAMTPLIRLLPHPYVDTPGEQKVVWVEAAVPVPPNGGPVEPWLAVAPFVAVANAVEFLFATYPEQVKPATTESFPMLIADRTEGAPRSVPPR